MSRAGVAEAQKNMSDLAGAKTASVIRILIVYIWFHAKSIGS